MTVPPPHGAGHASQCSNTGIAATHTRPWSNIRDQIGSLCARAQGLVVTVKPYQRRIGDSPHRSGECPTTAWCGPSLTVLKHRHCGHSHASRRCVSLTKAQGLPRPCYEKFPILKSAWKLRTHSTILDGRYVSSVSETQLDTLCIHCIWNFMRRLHMTSVSSVSGRRADTQCI